MPAEHSDRVGQLMPHTGGAAVRYDEEPFRIRTLEWSGGAPDTDPVVLVHGLNSAADVWEPVALGLAAAGHRVVAPELRGHGHSSGDGRGFSLAALAQDVERGAFARLDRPAVLVGHSLGGAVALELAARAGDSVSAVVLIAGFIEPDGPVEESIAALTPPLWQATADSWEALYLSYWAEQEPLPGWLQRYLDSTLRPDASGHLAPRLRLEDYQAICHSLATHRPSELARAFSAPLTAVLAGADETPVAQWQPADTIQASRPDAHVVVVPEGRHFLPISHAGVVQRIIESAGDR